MFCKILLLGTLKIIKKKFFQPNLWMKYLLLGTLKIIKENFLGLSTNLWRHFLLLGTLKIIKKTSFDQPLNWQWETVDFSEIYFDYIY